MILLSVFLTTHFQAEVDLIEHISKGSGSYYNQITVNSVFISNHVTFELNISGHYDDEI